MSVKSFAKRSAPCSPTIRASSPNMSFREAPSSLEDLVGEGLVDLVLDEEEFGLEDERVEELRQSIAKQGRKLELLRRRVESLEERMEEIEVIVENGL